MKRYDSYKDSGVQWIGEIPEHWTVGKIKYSDLVIMGQSPLSDECNSEGKGLPFLQGNAEFGELFPTPKLYCETANKSAEINDVLLSVRAPVGAINISNQKVGIGRGLCAVRPIKSISKFIYYWLLKSVEELDSISTGSTFKAVNLDDVKSLKFPIIGNSEQTAIANYLDQKTTQIDDLIAKKERLIQLLEEERTAIINQSVTKGLDSNVPMKDSGVEWLGEIPAHWDCFQLKRLISYGRKITYGIVQPGNFDPNGRFMVRGQDYSKGWADQETIFKVSPDIEEPYARARLAAGDILYTIVGAGVGNIAIVPDWLDGANITQTTARISVDPIKIFPKFCFYFLKSTIAKAYLDIYVKGAAQPGMNLSDLKLFYFTVPPLNEQILIANFIDQKSSEIDELSIKMSKEIELLKEYKTALISEVVTGKVDVSTSSTQVLGMKN